MVPVGPLFPVEAEAALDVFRELRIVDVAGCPPMGQVCRPWILDFVGSIFGAYNAETGKRLITEFFLLISKKNGKSTTAAGIMLTALIRNWRESAEFLILAPTIEAANNSFKPARDMVRKDPELSSLMYIQEHYRTITHRGTGATLKVVAADNETVGGKKATGVLVDELWLFGKQPNAESMLLEATGGQAARPEGFTIYLSTHADAAPAGVFEKKLKYARDVRDGKRVDPNFLPVLYEFPDRMLKAGEHREKKNWFITNPNLGASVEPDFLERKFAEAEHAGEDSLIGFMAKHLNVPIGTVLRSDGWAGADFWEVRGRSGLTLPELLKRSEVVTVGIDGGGLDDLLGLAVLGRDAETQEWLAWFHAWAHAVVLKKRKSEASRLLDLQAAGDLTIVEESGPDVKAVAEIVANVSKLGLLDKVGVDPVGIGSVLDALSKAGIPGDKVVGISQGWKLSGAIKTAERKLAEGVLVHCAQKLMAWCVGNARVEPKGNAILITKQASGTAKIDPLMAGFNAVQLMSLNPPSARTKFQLFTIGP
jgi:phage terminase large subunit-like protein